MPKLLLNELSEKKTATLLTSHVLEEVVTFLSAKDGAKKAFEVGHRLLNTQNVDVVWVQEKDIKAALEILRKHRGLSLCDAITAAISQDRAVETIYSFDTDFDKFEHSERVH